MTETNLSSEDPGSSMAGSNLLDPPHRARFPFITIAIVVLTLTATVFVLQSQAPYWDHQNANLLSMLACLVGTASVWFIIGRHQFSVSRGRRFVGLTIAALLSLVVLVRFDGFSGEMVPQLKYRFSRDKQPLGVAPVDRQQLEPVDLGAPESVALRDSVQFLGNDRDGTISRREFAVPQSASDLRELWRIAIGEGWSSFSVSGDRAVTMEQRGENECLTCYRLADGKLLWIDSHRARHENAMGGIGPRATPTITGGKVIAQGATGRVTCRELETGNEIWTVDLLKIAGWDQTQSEVAATWGRASSPLIAGDLCVVALGGPSTLAPGINGRSLIALNVDTGETVWTAGDDQLSYASPTIMTLAGVEQIVSVNESTITGHEIPTGEQLWTFPWPGQSNGGANCTQAIPAGENRFLIGKGYSGGSALVSVDKSASGELNASAIWTSSRVLKTKFTHSLVNNDVVYALSDGTMQAVSVDDGEILWRQPRLSRSGHGQALLVEDVLVLQNEAGTVVFVAADPTEYREHLTIDALSDRTWNIPTIAGRHLIVRNDHEAVCYLLPPRE